MVQIWWLGLAREERSVREKVLVVAWWDLSYVMMRKERVWGQR